MMALFVVLTILFVESHGFRTLEAGRSVRRLHRHLVPSSAASPTPPESIREEVATRTSTRSVCAAIQKAGRDGAWPSAIAEHRRYMSERGSQLVPLSDSDAEFALHRSARATKKCSTVYSATMGALAACGRPVEAAALWDEFRKEKLGPMPTFFGNEFLRALGAKKARGDASSRGQQPESAMDLDSRADLALTVLASMQRGCNSITNKSNTSPKSGITVNSSISTVDVNSGLSSSKASPFCPDAFTFANALTVLAEAGRWQQALAVYQAVPKSIVRDRSAKSNQEQVLLTACITGAANAKPPRPDVALALLASGSPDVVAYSAALTCLERASDWTGALKVLNEMIQRGVKPNAYTYAAAIGAYANGGQHSEALSLLRDAERYDDEVISSAKGVSSKSAPAPAAAAAAMKKRVATAPVYAAAVRALARAPAAERDSGKALALLQRMVTRGVAPTTRTANAYLDVRARSGDWKAAMALVQCMSTRSSSSCSCSQNRGSASSGKHGRSMIGQYHEPRHQPQDGEFEFLGVAELDLVSYNTALAACSRAAATAAADIAGTADETTSDDHSVLSAIWAGAMSLAQALRRDGFQPDQTTAGTLLLCAAHAAGEGSSGGLHAQGSDGNGEMHRRALVERPLTSPQAARGAAVVLRVLDTLLTSGCDVSCISELRSPLTNLATPSLEAAADVLDEQSGWNSSREVAADVLTVLNIASASTVPLSEVAYPLADEGVFAAAFVATEQAGSPSAALAVLRAATTSQKFGKGASFIEPASGTAIQQQQQQQPLPVPHACAVLGAIARSPAPELWAPRLVPALLEAASLRSPQGVADSSPPLQSTQKAKEFAGDANEEQSGEVALRVAAALAWLAADDSIAAAAVLSVAAPSNGDYFEVSCSDSADATTTYSFDTKSGKLEEGSNFNAVEAAATAATAASASASSLGTLDAKTSTMATAEVFRVLGDAERWPAAVLLFGALLRQGGLEHARSRAAALLLLRRLLRAPTSLSSFPSSPSPSSARVEDGPSKNLSVGGRLPFWVTAFLQHAFADPQSAASAHFEIDKTDTVTTNAAFVSVSSSTSASIHAWREAGGAQACLREACLAYNEMGEFERADEAYALAMATGIAKHWVLDSAPTGDTARGAATAAVAATTAGATAVAAAPGKATQSQWAVDLHGCSLPVAQAAIRAALREHHALFPPPSSFPALSVAQALQSDENTNNVAAGDDSAIATSVKSLGTSDNSSSSSSLSGSVASVFVDLVVITGRGLHSNEWLRPVLRPDVQSLLVERFNPPISSWTVPGNTGRLVVDAVGIAAWAEQSKQTKAALMRRLSGALFSKRVAARQTHAPPVS